MKCLACNAEIKKLNTFHFNSKCNVSSFEEYTLLFPGAPLEDPSVTKKRSDSTKKNWHTTSCYSKMPEMLRNQSKRATAIRKEWYKSMTKAEQDTYMKSFRTAGNRGCAAWWARMSEDERTARIDRFINDGRQGVIKMWANMTPDERAKRWELWMNKSSFPTSIEKKVIDFKIQNLEYTGAGSFWVKVGARSRNPDFVCRKVRQIVELFGDYWHSPEVTGMSIEEHEKEVRTFYREAGWEVLILWEHEINQQSEDCRKKIVASCNPQRLHDGHSNKSEDIVRTSQRCEESSRNALIAK